MAPDIGRGVARLVADVAGTSGIAELPWQGLCPEPRRAEESGANFRGKRSAKEAGQIAGGAAWPRREARVAAHSGRPRASGLDLAVFLVQCFPSHLQSSELAHTHAAIEHLRLTFALQAMVAMHARNEAENREP